MRLGSVIIFVRITASQLHSIPASPDHSIIPSLHHFITASLHHLEEKMNKSFHAKSAKVGQRRQRIGIWRFENLEVTELLKARFPEVSHKAHEGEKESSQRKIVLMFLAKGAKDFPQISQITAVRFDLKTGDLKIWKWGSLKSSISWGFTLGARRRKEAQEENHWESGVDFGTWKFENSFLILNLSPQSFPRASQRLTAKGQ